MATLDILPGCVSSVYFMYSNQWAWLQLGKVSLYGPHSIMVWKQSNWSFLQVSALREVGLAQEMHAAGLSDLKWLYMGEPEASAHFYS